ncbi:DUF4390 domain-containing protein, partial [Neisseria meningitidis]
MLPVFQNVPAGGADVSRAEARLTDGGQLSISRRFQTELPDLLPKAFSRGST